MLYRVIVTNVFLVCLGLLLTSANLHLQTSANHDTKVLKIHFLGQTLHASLSAPGTSIEKYANGRLRYISFFQINEFYQVYFHPTKEGQLERVSLVQQFTVRGDEILLDGASYSFSEQGTLLTESHWKEGRRHGKHLVFDETGQLREEKLFYEDFPVGTWSLYYSDGTLASTITFPNDDGAWKNTEAQLTPSLWERYPMVYTMPFHTAIPAVQTWYNPDGSKQKEKEIKLYVENGHARILKHDPVKQ